VGISGIPFAVYWGWSRFRKQGAIFFALWPCVCAALAYLACAEEMHEQDGLQRDQYDFAQDAASRCVATQSHNPANKGAHVSDTQILRYCTCFGRGLAGVITTSELASYAESTQVPATLQKKILSIAPQCRDEAKQ
jgi:hypothetical protein